MFSTHFLSRNVNFDCLGYHTLQIKNNIQYTIQFDIVNFPGLGPKGCNWGHKSQHITALVRTNMKKKFI